MQNAWLIIFSQLLGVKRQYGELVVVNWTSELNSQGAALQAYPFCFNIEIGRSQLCDGFIPVWTAEHAKSSSSKYFVAFVERKYFRANFYRIILQKVFGFPLTNLKL